jgi:hypothetical protein
MSTDKKSTELKKIDEKAVFKPTPTMEKWVAIAIQSGSDNVAEICRETQVTESAYYQWKKNPQFSKWMNDYANQLIRGDGWKLQNIGMRNAKRDFRYWESMQKIVGNINETSQVQNNIQFNSFFKIDDGTQTGN